MKKFHTAVLGLAAGAAAAFVATGADANGRRSIKDEPRSAPFSWTGFYAGLHGGYAWSDADWDFVSGSGATTDRLTGGSAPVGVSQSPDGLIAGGQIGYNWQTGPWVLGVEATLSGGALDDRFKSNFAGTAQDDIYKTEISWLFLGTARLGFASDRWLAYVKGGYAAARVELSTTDVVGGNQGSASSKRTHDGWTVGVGAEYMLVPGVTFGVEYNYIDLESARHTQTFNGSGGANVDDVDPNIHTITGRLNFKIGG